MALTKISDFRCQIADCLLSPFSPASLPSQSSRFADVEKSEPSMSRFGPSLTDITTETVGKAENGMLRGLEDSSLVGRIIRAGLLLAILSAGGCHALWGVRPPPDLPRDMVQARLSLGGPDERPNDPLDAGPFEEQEAGSSQSTRERPKEAEETLPAPRLFVQPDPPAPGFDSAMARGTLTLGEAITEALKNNPRLRVAQEQVSAAKAGADIAFSPFLPQVDIGDRYSGFNVPVLPAASFVPAGLTQGTQEFNLAELGLQWTLLDFGRTAGRYGQAVTRTEIAELQLARAKQTVAYEVASAYFRLLLSQAARRVREQALRQGQAVLKDARTRLKAGVVDRDAVLRAEVEVSEDREALVVAREQVLDAEARLNLTMGRNVSLAIQVMAITSEPAFNLTLEDSLEQAVEQRLEIGVARKAIALAYYGEQAARAEFLPRLYVRSSVIRVDGGALSGTVVGAGIHLDQNVYSGGRRLGEKRRNEALVRAALADSQVIIDNIALEVNVAYRAIAASRERIRLGETAVAQARENLRLTVVKYKNGNATSTEIVDAQTALTRAQMRYYSALYDYVTALARLEYASGGDQSKVLERVGEIEN